MTDYFTEQDVVLENKLGIEDPAAMQKAEADIVFLRLAELGDKPLQGAFDYEHLKEIHKHLFSDIYMMAGETRTVNIAKEGSAFCYAQHIGEMQQKIFDGLRCENYFIGLEKDEFVCKLAELSGDLNALHPFREGNGRAIRCFLQQLAENVGYTMSFDNINRDELLTADIAAFNGDIEPLATLYGAIVKPYE